MIFTRRCSPTNSRSRKLVVRIARRWFTGIHRWAMRALKSSLKQATALGPEPLGRVFGGRPEVDPVGGLSLDLELGPQLLGDPAGEVAHPVRIPFSRRGALLR